MLQLEVVEHPSHHRGEFVYGLAQTVSGSFGVGVIGGLRSGRVLDERAVAEATLRRLGRMCCRQGWIVHPFDLLTPLTICGDHVEPTNAAKTGRRLDTQLRLTKKME